MIGRRPKIRWHWIFAYIHARGGSVGSSIQNSVLLQTQSQLAVLQEQLYYNYYSKLPLCDCEILFINYQCIIVNALS